MKRKIFVAITSLFVFGVLSLFTINIVHAAEDRYPSTLQISTGSSHIGSENTYRYPNHKISMLAEEILFWYGDTSSITVSLNKKGALFWGDTEKTLVATYNREGQTVTLNYGNMGTGKFRYHFNTGTGINPTGAFYMNPVYMYATD